MCGRYLVSTEQEILEMREMIGEIQKKFGPSLDMKTGEIFPTDRAPILAPGSGGIRAQPMTWGFPRWDKSGVIINAKAETAMLKNMFRSSLAERRCVVPSTGFFEWRHAQGKKQKDKYLIRFEDSPVLYMAGIYNLFRQPDGTLSSCFVILTTAANGSVSQVHDRMPVVLKPEEKEIWIRNAESVDGFLKRAGPELALYKVS